MEDMEILMKRFFLFVFFTALTVISTGNQCPGMITEESILNRPILEGESLAGVSIGDHESDVFKVIGFPDNIFSDFPGSSTEPPRGFKIILYSIKSGGLLLIHSKDQRVGSIAVVRAYEGSMIGYKGKTRKGVGLGDSMDEVRRKYGKPTREENNWYKGEGIAFSADEKGLIQGIQIVEPNFDYEKLFGGKR
jgi:hypothetical protein